MKSNLIELPFPKITAEENAHLTALVDDILTGSLHRQAEIEKFIFAFYGISEAQVKYIGRVVNGKAD